MRSMVKRWVLVGTVALFGVHGCTSPGTTTGGSHSRPAPARPAVATGHLIEPGAASELGYRIGWARDMQLTRTQRITSAVVLGDLLVTVERPLNFVTARSVSDGTLKWKVQLGSRLEQFYTPVRDGEEIFINSQSRIFTLKAHTGDVLTIADLDTVVDSGPRYDPSTGFAIFGGSGGTIFAHSTQSNFAHWRYQLPGRIESTPVGTDREVFVIDNEGNYVMLQASTGAFLWRNRTLGGVVTQPVIHSNDVFIASQDRKLYALNRTSGQDTWQYLGGARPLTHAPVALGRTVVLPLPPDGGIVALNALNGEERWASPVNATPVLERDRELVLYTDRGMVLMNLQDGAVRAQVPTRPIQEVMAGPDHSLILINSAGRLLRINRAAH